MHRILHAQRRASCATAIITNNSRQKTQLLPHLLNLNNRPISTTSPTHQAMVPPKTSPDEAATKQKKVMKEKKGSSAAVLRARETKSNQLTEFMRIAFDAPYREPPKASPEEMERRHNVGRNYVIGSFRRHNEENHDLACKIRMKHYAMRQLPKEGHIGDEIVNGKSLYGGWREEAHRVNDDWGPPDHRHIPMHTPPIPGFDPNLYIDQEDEDN